MSNDKHLFAEHEEILNLLIHEDRLAWELVYILIIINLGLVSATGVLLSEHMPLHSFVVILALCFAGAIVSFFWFFVFHRNRIHRRSLMNRGLMIEKQLQKRGLPVRTLEFFHLDIERGRVLANSEGGYMQLIRRERMPALKRIRHASLVIGILWLLVSIWLFVTHALLPVLLDC